jgi:hypothetical protein
MKSVRIEIGGSRRVAEVHTGFGSATLALCPFSPVFTPFHYQETTTGSQLCPEHGLLFSPWGGLPDADRIPGRQARIFRAAESASPQELVEPSEG